LFGSTINDRYKLLEVLGEGGIGTVYHAHDATLKRDVAVKLLSNKKLGADRRARMLNEAQTAANLNHPNIVTIYDAGIQDETPYIIMEFVEGQTLYDKKPEALEEIVRIAKFICKALEHAHGQGIIHRDLKPENVIIDQSNNIKLMDFGLARSIATRMSSEGKILGTVFYMAPEQVSGGDLDGRTDLYALGVMLYEFITGELPFVGEGPVAIITQHLNAPVVPPRAKYDDLPPRLNDLIVALLSKSPDDRPESATETLELLDDPRLLENRATGEYEITTLDRIVRGRMVGREEEYAQARQLWMQASAGQGQTLLVSGEPGVGKTRLIQEIITQAEVTLGYAFAGECHPEGNTPYSAFSQIVRRVLRKHGKNGMEFPHPVLADLLKLSPELSSQYPNIPPNIELDPEAEQRRLLEHMVIFCQVITENAPLLLVLEDLHWADSSTLVMMNQLARRTARMPIMVLGSYREVELDEALPFHQALQSLKRQNTGTRSKLERLDRGKTKELLATIFNEGITPEFLDGIYHETDGNPFFIEEVCKALIESGQLVFIDGRWDRPEMEDLRIPQGVKVAIQSRVTKLSEATQNILLFAAVVGRVFDFQTLEDVSEKDEDSLIDSLEEALRAQLIEEIRDTGGEGFSFSHALIPYTLRESVSGLRRSRLHRKVAAAIEKTAPDNYERLAHHWGEAGNDEKGLLFTIKAAKRARQTYANEEAVRLYTEALALLPDDHPQRYAMLHGRAQVYHVINKYERQKTDAESMLAIAEKQNDPVLKMDALLELTRYCLAAEVHKANEYADQVISLAETTGNNLHLGYAYSLLGRQNQRTYNFTASQEHLEKAAVLLKESGLVKQAVENLSYLSVLYAITDKEAVQSNAQKALQLSKESGDKLLEATATRRLAIAQGATYQYDEALITVQVALDMFRTLGDRCGEAHSLNVRGLTFTSLGNYSKAEKDFHSVTRISEEIGEDSGIRWGVRNMLELYNYYTGDYEIGLKLAEAQAIKARQMDNQFILLDQLLSVQFQYFILGQYRIALDIMQENLPAGEEFLDLGILTQIRFYNSELHLLLGEEDQARRVFESSFDVFSKQEFEPILTLFIMDQIIKTSLLLPTVISLKDVLQEIERLTSSFREKNDLENLINGLYSTSKIHLALAETDQTHIERALENLEEAEKVKRTIRPDYIFIEHQLYLHARANRLAGLDKVADSYLKDAFDWLMTCAGKITTPEYRQSYLENVPQNVAIQAEYMKHFSD